MIGPITRYKIAAYVLDFIGIILVVFYLAGGSPKIALAYQAPVAFLYLGIALIVSGTALIFYDMKKSTASQAKQQKELD